MSGQDRVSWQSVRWPDHCTYEGLVKEDKCHIRGVFKYSNGDRYEGEFQDNQMSGYGVYVWGQEGSVYRGQWSNSMMDGCGVKITKQPNGTFLAEEGQFVNDEWVSRGLEVGDVMACTVEQARAAAAEADTAAQMARVFELGSSAPGSEAAKAAEAAAAAAAAAATARPAKLRQQQRQQQQPEASTPAAVEPPSSSAGPTTAVVSPHTQPIRQRPQGPLGLMQEAVHGVQLALQRVLRGNGR